MYAPISGEVLEINSALVDDPSKVREGKAGNELWAGAPGSGGAGGAGAAWCWIRARCVYGALWQKTHISDSDLLCLATVQFMTPFLTGWTSLCCCR